MFIFSVIKCLVDNIRDQNSEGTLAHQFGAFNIGTTESLESRIEKVSALYEIYGVDKEHVVEKKW